MTAEPGQRSARGRHPRVANRQRQNDMGRQAQRGPAEPAFAAPYAVLRTSPDRAASDVMLMIDPPPLSSVIGIDPMRNPVCPSALISEATRSASLSLTSAITTAADHGHLSRQVDHG